MIPSHRTEAWVLAAGSGAANSSGVLSYGSFSYPECADDEVLVEPMVGSWEANMDHAIERNPVDICRQRGEPQIVLGNAGVVRVKQCGAAVEHLRIGDKCLLFCGGKLDSFGYVELVFAYDMPGTVGLLARETKTLARNLFRIAPDSPLSLHQWAAFSTRYLTAWSNWQQANGCLRLQLSSEELPRPYVWGWGGGTTLAELALATRCGCRTLMIVGNDSHRQEAVGMGVATIDRREFPGLVASAQGEEGDLAIRRTRLNSERRFLRAVQDLTDGNGVSIFIDYLGGSTLDLSLRALGRQGVLATAGWKFGVRSSITRANECIKRHTHVHTHYARLSDVPAAMSYAEANGWRAQVSAVYPYSEVPRLATEYHNGQIPSYFPLYEVTGL
jgi:NADPH:quinone reductase-like Zn-dependent oxidoreductase